MFKYEVAAGKAQATPDQTENSLDLFQSVECGKLESRQGKAQEDFRNSENPLGIDIDKDAVSIAKLLNIGRSDLAVSAMSNDLIHLKGNQYNSLLLKISELEEAEVEGDERGHLLLSGWNEESGTWDQVYVAERDQLYRFVQPGNTLTSIAADRLGEGAGKDAVARYAQNIAEVNSIPHPELILRGQALKLPYPY